MQYIIKIIFSTIPIFFLDPVPETQALGLKISGPKQVLFNEQARFKCSANQKDIELDMNVYQDNKNTLKSEIKTFNDGHGEIRLNPGDVQHGTQQFYIECGAYNADKDWDSVKHFVEVFLYLKCTSFLLMCNQRRITFH